MKVRIYRSQIFKTTAILRQKTSVVRTLSLLRKPPDSKSFTVVFIAVIIVVVVVVTVRPITYRQIPSS